MAEAERMTVSEVENRANESGVVTGRDEGMKTRQGGKKVTNQETAWIQSLGEMSVKIRGEMSGGSVNVTASLCSPIVLGY